MVLRDKQPALWSGALAIPLLVLTVVAALFSALWMSTSGPSGWQHFTDPRAGFSLSFPSSWKAYTEADGSNPTLLNPQTRTTLSPVVTVVRTAPDAVLAHLVPPTATQRHTRTVAGQSAVDFVLPPDQPGGAPGTAPASVRMRDVVFATRNVAGSTNVYSLVLEQPVDAAGKLSAAAQKDSATFDQVLASFQLQASGFLPNAGGSGPPPAPRALPASQCDSVCWADANWNFNDTAGDTSGRTCASYDPTTASYQQCSNQELTVPGEYQPGEQCAEFAARALARAGLVPGLASGGTDGTGGPGGSSQWATMSYGTYPFALAADPSGSSFALLNVGTDTLLGLYQYLVTSGIAVDEHQNLAAARPGDLVFFYDTSTAGTQLGDSTRDHVMVIASAFRDGSTAWGTNGWDALLDGHNRAAYRTLLSAHVSSTLPFDVLHLRASSGTLVKPNTQGSGWQKGTDSAGQPFAAVQTTNAAKATASVSVGAPAHLHGSGTGIAIYVPDGHATADINVAVRLASGKTVSRSVHENNLSGWVMVFPPGSLPADPVQVSIGNNTGAANATLGVGQIAFFR